MLNAERETPNACPNAELSDFIRTVSFAGKCVMR